MANGFELNSWVVNWLEIRANFQSNVQKFDVQDYRMIRHYLYDKCGFDRI